MTKVRVGSGVNVRGGRPSTIKVYEDGVFVASASKINFTGSADIAYDVANDIITVNITGGGTGEAGSSVGDKLYLFNAY